MKTFKSEDHLTVPRRLTRGRRLLFLALPYVAFALLLGAVEAGTRLVLPHVSLLAALVESQQQQADFSDRAHVTIFAGDPLLFWRLQPNLDKAVWDFTVVSTNGQGLRHEGDIGRKQAGALRVVCLGDSVTFGYRVPVVFPQHPEAYAPDWLPYPMLLERRLRAANPGRQIEVIALAVPGYTSYQGLLWLRRDIAALQPDVVTVCFGWNDINLRARPDSVAMPASWAHVFYRRLLGYSQALTHAALWLQRRKAERNAPAPPAANIPRVPQAEFVNNMLEIAHLAGAHGATALIIAPVYRDAVTNPPEAARIRAHRDALRAAAQANGVPYLEIQALTETNYPATQQLFGELIHPNHEGHRLLATELLRYFAAHDTLKGLHVPQGL
ncbi:MAG TPA: SGNH/GDSL hydrolase family protein [Pyrinomonadaceae bacterium]|nr:SGNH/GDSL hydrolase family protein [Pyrinomonadaceae bacterium]